MIHPIWRIAAWMLCISLSPMWVTGSTTKMNDTTNTELRSALQDVKERVVDYLLGGAGDGAYRKDAIRAVDEACREILGRDMEPLTWQDSEEMRMNQRLSARASELLQLAVAYRSEGGSYQGSEEVKQRIIRGLDNILEHVNSETPRPGNWHPWLIVLPRSLGAIGLLMEPTLPSELLARLRESLAHELSTEMVLTGVNASWEARNHIYLALLDEDTERLHRAAVQVFQSVRYSPRSGVREDYGYLFHGNVPYAGGYGSGFVQTAAEFIYLFDGTPWAISPFHRDLVVNLILEHTRWYLAGGRVDLHVLGRSYPRGNSFGGGAILEALAVLARAEGPRSDELAETAAALLKHEPRMSMTLAGFSDQLSGVDGALPKGFRYWPSSEMGAFRQPSFHVGFRQFSTRVQDYEYLIGQGAEGWNLAYGFANIIRKDGAGVWSQNVMREIDMKYLPGSTSRIGGHPVNPPASFDRPTTTGYSLNFGTSPFAGGVGWGAGGVAGFILEPAYGEFTARKSLHFFPQGYWALGSGIVSTASAGESTSGKPVCTTVLQWVCRAGDIALKLPNGSIALADKSEKSLEGVNWFWVEEEDVGVVFADPARIQVRRRGQVLTVWLDHGEQPEGERYAYAVLPASSLEETQRFARELPVHPVRHDDRVHAVRDDSRANEGILFFEADTASGITSDSPAIVYRSGDVHGGILTIQDPLHETRTMKLTTELGSEVTRPEPVIQVKRTEGAKVELTVEAAFGRIYRLGYGTAGRAAYGEPREELAASYYEGFRVEAESDPEATILTVHMPEDAVRDGYRLSVRARASQLLHVLSDEDLLDRPAPHILRYRWVRKPAEGPPVFRDHLEHMKHLRQSHGSFRVMLVTPRVEFVDSFTVPEFDKGETRK